MKLEIPAQLRGPETRQVMSAAIRVRKNLEVQFSDIDDNRKISPILRVGGSLGTFGKDGLENIVVNAEVLTCDVVLAPRVWEELDEKELYSLITARVIEASSVLLENANIQCVPKCISEYRNAEQSLAGDG